MSRDRDRDPLRDLITYAIIAGCLVLAVLVAARALR